MTENDQGREIQEANKLDEALEPKETQKDKKENHSKDETKEEEEKVEVGVEHPAELQRFTTGEHPSNQNCNRPRQHTSTG